MLLGILLGFEFVGLWGYGGGGGYDSISNSIFVDYDKKDYE